MSREVPAGAPMAANDVQRLVDVAQAFAVRTFVKFVFPVRLVPVRIGKIWRRACRSSSGPAHQHGSHRRRARSYLLTLTLGRKSLIVSSLIAGLFSRMILEVS